MAATATPRNADRTVAVACSGGRDSLALLHATAHAAPPGTRVLALHVHHGLMPQADDWLEHVRGTCRRWAARGLPVAFDATRLQGAPGPGESVEAWARKGRYRALAEMSRRHGAALVLLAHHRRDQAETVLLQALRGAGPAGLAAMPRTVERDGIVWARPWLDRDADAIAAYVRRHRLRPVEDPSNADPAFDRSRLRRDVWPALLAAFPAAEPALAAVAARAQEAQQALDTIADDDLRAACGPQGLSVARWQALPAARRRQALQRWWRTTTGRGMPATLAERLMAELAASSAPARWPAPGGELRRYRGWLRWQPLAGATRGSTAVAPSTDLARPGLHRVPGVGACVRVRHVERGGLPLALLAHAAWRLRTGGESFQRAPRSTPRSLKKQFQAAGVPAWARGAPLLWAGDRLLWVPGLGPDARALAALDEPQAQIDWQPD